MVALFTDQIYTIMGNNVFQLTPKSGEDIVVKDIWVHNPATNYVTVTISESTVGYFRVASTYFGNHLPFPLNKGQMSIIAFFNKMGKFPPYPVQQNETFAISGAAQTGAVVAVLYDRYKAGDIKNTMPNGSKATERWYIEYGRSSAALANGLNNIDNPLNPVQFDEYPFGVRVPDNAQLDIHAMLASPVGLNLSTSTRMMNYNFIKLIRNEDILGDVFNLEGYVYNGDVSNANAINVVDGQSPGGNYDSVDSRVPFVFNPVISGEAGTRLTTQIQVTEITGSITISTIGSEVAFLINKKAK